MGEADGRKKLKIPASTLVLCTVCQAPVPACDRLQLTEFHPWVPWDISILHSQDPEVAQKPARTSRPCLPALSGSRTRMGLRLR